MNIVRNNASTFKLYTKPVAKVEDLQNMIRKQENLETDLVLFHNSELMGPTEDLSLFLSNEYQTSLFIGKTVIKLLDVKHYLLFKK